MDSKQMPSTASVDPVVITTLRFRSDNRIRYGQDHHQHRGIPSGVDFTVERFGDSKFKLTAHGFGQLKPYSDDSYGNGCLYVWGLTTQQRKRFEDACQS